MIRYVSVATLRESEEELKNLITILSEDFNDDLFKRPIIIAVFLLFQPFSFSGHTHLSSDC